MNIVQVPHGKGHRGGNEGCCWFCLDCMSEATRTKTNAPGEGPYCHKGGREERVRLNGHWIHAEAARRNCKCKDKTPKEGSYGYEQDQDQP